MSGSRISQPMICRRNIRSPQVLSLYRVHSGCCQPVFLYSRPVSSCCSRYELCPISSIARLSIDMMINIECIRQSPCRPGPLPALRGDSVRLQLRQGFVIQAHVQPVRDGLDGNCEFIFVLRLRPNALPRLVGEQGKGRRVRNDDVFYRASVSPRRSWSSPVE